MRINESMYKSDLIKIISEKSNISTIEARKIVDVFFDSISHELANGGRVEIRKFGTFYLAHSNSYNGFNPMTGKPIAIEAKYRPIWRSSSHIVERINLPQNIEEDTPEPEAQKEEDVILLGGDVLEDRPQEELDSHGMPLAENEDALNQETVSLDDYHDNNEETAPSYSKFYDSSRNTADVYNDDDDSNEARYEYNRDYHNPDSIPTQPYLKAVKDDDDTRTELPKAHQHEKKDSNVNNFLPPLDLKSDLSKSRQPEPMQEEQKARPVEEKNTHGPKEQPKSDIRESKSKPSGRDRLSKKKEKSKDKKKKSYRTNRSGQKIN